MTHTTERPFAPYTPATSAAERCLICHTPLTLLDGPTRPTCRSSACRWRYSTMPAAERCRVCGQPLSIAERVSRVCGREACRHARMREWTDWREQRRVEEEARHAEAVALRAERAAALGVPDPETYTVAMVPFVGAGFAPVPRERRRRLRENLTRLATAAAALPAGEGRTDDAVAYPEEPEPTPELQRLLGTGCGSCRGYCCGNAGERAFLAVATLRRVLDANPRLTARGAVARYLKHVAPETQQGSCIFHGVAGCTLPRAMRSDTCNRYFCGALVQLRRTVEKGALPRAFFVPRAEHAVGPGVLADAGATPGTVGG